MELQHMEASGRNIGTAFADRQMSLQSFSNRTATVDKRSPVVEIWTLTSLVTSGTRARFYN